MKTKQHRKALPSSWRVKKRYILLELQSDPPIPESSVRLGIEKAMLSAFGKLGSAVFQLAILRFDPVSQTIILRCNRQSVESVVSALLISTTIDSARVRWSIKAISGTIRGLEKKAPKK